MGWLDARDILEFWCWFRMEYSESKAVPELVFLDVKVLVEKGHTVKQELQRLVGA